MAKTRQSGNAEFEAIELSELEKVSVVAQALDNQWVPRAMLHQMMHADLTLDDVKAEREQSVRTEYLRALINARQVVINRAYLYNNPVVFQDYLQPGENHEAFTTLLRQGVIVPYLFNEQSPLDKPGYTTDPRGFPAWEHLCQEVCIRCVRLSWDDATNGELIREQLARRFHDFAQTVNTGDTAVFTRELGLPPEARNPLRQRFGDVVRKCADFADQDQLATREELYKVFVTADGTPPSMGKYDKNKPFAGEIKQLLDLKYNTNLPDALGGYPLTPIDSLPRTALQEWQQVSQQREITADQLVTLLQRSAFDLVQGGLYLASVGSLSLQDLHAVRRMDTWAQYIRSLEDLLADPWQFDDRERGAWAVYRHYVALAEDITNVVTAKRTQERTAHWTPIIETVFDIAGAVLSVIWSDQGIFYQIAGEVSNRVATGAAPVVARLIVRGFTEQHGAQADLRTSIDFMRGRMQHARSQWRDLVQQLSQFPGFQSLPHFTTKPLEATMNYAEVPNA
jgi:hypothetical protein